MTREEQIKCYAVNNYIQKLPSWIHQPSDEALEYAKAINKAFCDGAKWADSHPNWHSLKEKPKVDTVLGAFHEIIHGGICYDMQETEEFLHYRGNYTYPVAWMEIPKYKENE